TPRHYRSRDITVGGAMRHSGVTSGGAATASVRCTAMASSGDPTFRPSMRRFQTVTARYAPVPLEPAAGQAPSLSAAEVPSIARDSAVVGVSETVALTILLVARYSVGMRLGEIAGAHGCSVTAVDSVEAARDMLTRKDFDLVIMASDLLDSSGADLLSELAGGDWGGSSIVLVAAGDGDTATRAMQLGAVDVLFEPLDEPALICCALVRVAARLSLQRRNAQLAAELDASNRTLSALAVRDPLTKLLNHVELQDRLERELAHCAHQRGSLSVLLIDIDDFRNLNEHFGHAAGDRALRSIAEHLGGIFGSDATGVMLSAHDVLARYSGDRFAIMLPGAVRGTALGKAESLRRSIAEVDWSARDLPGLSVSVGLSTYPEDIGDRAGLLRCAELAVVAAKQSGGDRVVGYTPTMATLVSSERETAQRARRLHVLERAIAEHDFDFIYQPIARTDGGSVVGFEALCRPREPELRDIRSMLATAESAGLLGRLGRVMRQCATGALRALPEDARLFVNLHPRELHDPDFAAIVRLLAGWTERVVLELTEFAALVDTDAALSTVRWLRESGFGIALDDVGAGYSGLNTLAAIAPDYVKLDMQLVWRAAEDRRAARLVRHIIEFAHEEDIQVIAEGVETRAQHALAGQLGCDLVQGFLIGRGCSVDALAIEQRAGL
ncbi:MAG: EAL domain-containing protein, partial [Myxococcota bacterium]